MNLSTKSNSLRTARPENVNGRNVRSRLTSIQKLIETAKTAPTEEQKTKFAVSYLIGDGLQWWELININKHNSIYSFEDFKRELLKNFEPVHREINAKKALSNLKQMGELNSISSYNAEFSKWLLQVPTMAGD